MEDHYLKVGVVIFFIISFFWSIMPSDVARHSFTVFWVIVWVLAFIGMVIVNLFPRGPGEK